jgi:hypothetical protein
MTDATPSLPTPKERTPRVPPKVREAIRLLVEGDCKTIAAAGRRVGLSREYLSRALHQRHVSAYLIDKIQRHVAVGGARGAARMVKLVDAAKSEHVQFDSARFLLGVAGVKPAADANVNLNVDVRAGFVIDLTEPNVPARPGEIISSADPPKIIDITPALAGAPAVTSRRGQG